MRSAIGPDVAIMVDYNQCLTAGLPRFNVCARLKNANSLGQEERPRWRTIIKATRKSPVKFRLRFSAAKTGGVRST